MTASAPFPLAGELAALLAAVIWASTTSIYTRHGRHLSARGLNIFKNSLALACFLFAAGTLGTVYPGDWRGWGALAFSGFFGLALGDSFLFAALKRIGAQAATALQCLAPPLTAILAFSFLGEAMGTVEIFGLALCSLAVLGVVLAQSPRRDKSMATSGSWRNTGEGILYGLASALCNAIGIIAARDAMSQSGLIGGTIARLLPALFCLLIVVRLRQEPMPYRQAWARLHQGVYLSVAAIAGTFLGLLLLTAGVKYAKAGVTSALSSSYPIWVIPMAKYGLREQISPFAMACTILAVVGIGLMVLF